MPKIVLTNEQARILTEAREPVEFRDADGKLVGRIAIPLEDEVAEACRRLASDRPRWQADQVEKLMARLTEIRETEGMDETRLRQALARFREGQPV